MLAAAPGQPLPGACNTAHVTVGPQQLASRGMACRNSLQDRSSRRTGSAHKFCFQVRSSAYTKLVCPCMHTSRLRPTAGMIEVDHVGTAVTQHSSADQSKPDCPVRAAHAAINTGNLCGNSAACKCLQTHPAMPAVDTCGLSVTHTYAGGPSTGPAVTPAKAACSHQDKIMNCLE